MQDNETSLLADDPALQFGGSVSSIVKDASSSIQDISDISKQSDNPAKELINELKSIPPPRITRSEVREGSNESKHKSNINLCQRDYTIPCPLGFTHEYIDNKHHCNPPVGYSGPCLGQDIVYTTMDAVEKRELSKNCLFNWPCINCKRKYSTYCPDEWELENGLLLLL
ncbi:hypothetical protein BEWA_007550 [Theileria equi strain WA]|uniref:CPW-WPC domain-containing protein n=1 Tax=Theileria equi strain WA TaxID=1537102 RepID=L0B282_THEEQ|nr:hypothetical protein BEWA_007550 [Theileria equi strain WA]AFZ81346.1 hypothetical protein BEWA_007550 [Theileria equi strain WA]|eukprot:XP_004831012.1 hypothetical protein BEWA_007550 [Theileria equi strain WA]